MRTLSERQKQANAKWAKQLAEALGKTLRSDVCRFACPVCKKGSSDTAGQISLDSVSGKASVTCFRCRSSAADIAEAAGAPAPPWVSSGRSAASDSSFGFSSVSGYRISEEAVTVPLSPKAADVRKAWNTAERIQGTPAEMYVRSEKPEEISSDSLRWLPAGKLFLKSVERSNDFSRWHRSQNDSAGCMLVAYRDSASANVKAVKKICLTGDGKISGDPAEKERIYGSRGNSRYVPSSDSGGLYPAADKIFAAAEPIDGTPAETYLRDRLNGIHPLTAIRGCLSDTAEDPVLPLRWLPAGSLSAAGGKDLVMWRQKHGITAGALVAAYTDLSGSIARAELTPISSDGRQTSEPKRKQFKTAPGTSGRSSRDGCWLSPPSYTPEHPLVIAEGVVTALAAAALLSLAGRTCGGIAATGSAARFWVLSTPAYARCVYWLDRDRASVDGAFRTPQDASFIMLPSDIPGGDAADVLCSLNSVDLPAEIESYLARYYPKNIKQEA